MTAETERRLGRVQFVRGSIVGLIGIAKAEQLDMLAYLLEMARLEAEAVESTLTTSLAKPE